MELTEKVVREVKAAARTQEDLKKLIKNLKGQIAIEQQNLNLIKGNANSNSIQLEGLTKTGTELAHREESSISIRETLNMALTTKTYLKKYLSRFEPNEEQQAQEFERLKAIYDKLVQSYESNSDYVRVIEAQKKSEEFDQLINEKRNEYMRLEAAEMEYVA